MKLALAAFLTLAMGTTALATDGDKNSYTVDTEESTIQWFGKKVTGAHEGVIHIKSGTVEMDGDKLKGGEFTIDMTSITVTDLTGDMNGKLTGHLKSDDFFGVEQHPEARMVITKVKSKDDGYWVTADMTIKGITNPVEFMAMTESKNGKTFAKAEITIDRSKYNVRYGSNSFFDNLGDKAIYDNFDLKVKLVLNDQAS